MLTNQQIAEKWAKIARGSIAVLGIDDIDKHILSAIREATACAEERSKQQAERIACAEKQSGELEKALRYITSQCVGPAYQLASYALGRHCQHPIPPTENRPAEQDGSTNRKGK